MASPMQPSIRHVFESSTAYQTEMHTEFAVLLISSDIESRRTVSKVLETLSAQVTSCCTLSQARQALSLQRPNLIFCEERLPDGGYEDLLDLEHERRIPPP